MLGFMTEFNTDIDVKLTKEHNEKLYPEDIISVTTSVKNSSKNTYAQTTAIIPFSDDTEFIKESVEVEGKKVVYDFIDTKNIKVDLGSLKKDQIKVITYKIKAKEPKGSSSTKVALQTYILYVLPGLGTELNALSDADEKLAGYQKAYIEIHKPEIKIDTTKEKPKKQVTPKVKKDNSSYILGLHLGQGYTPYEQVEHQGSTILENEPGETFNLAELSFEVEKFLPYGMRPYVSLSYSQNSELTHYYGLVGVHKYFSIDDLKTYLGLQVGYGQLKWEYDPLESSKEVTSNTSSYITSLNAGLEYGLGSSWLLHTGIKFLYHVYETELEPTTTQKSTIENKYTVSATLGLKYRF
jgi:opacity protein-like surface antigen